MHILFSLFIEINHFNFVLNVVNDSKKKGEEKSKPSNKSWELLIIITATTTTLASEEIMWHRECIAHMSILRIVSNHFRRNVRKKRIIIRWTMERKTQQPIEYANEQWTERLMRVQRIYALVTVKHTLQKSYTPQPIRTKCSWKKKSERVKQWQINMVECKHTLVEIFSTSRQTSIFELFSLSANAIDLLKLE